MSKVNDTEMIEFCTDAILPQREVHLESAEISERGRLQVTLNGETLQFPVDWLRRNCQCAKCFNPDALSFTSLLEHTFRQENSLQAVSIVEGGVKCNFNDDHEVVFSANWLYNRRMTEEGNKERLAHIFLYNVVPWPKPEDMRVKRADYKEVTETDAGYTYFATALIKDGVCVITGAPADRSICEEFAELTGLLPSANHFNGLKQGSIVVKAQPLPTSLAYTTDGLELHVDQAYLNRTPDIVILHCMVQSNVGGENILSDGIKAARILQERYPRHFKVLTTQKVQTEDLFSARKGDVGQAFMATILTTIRVDEKGEPIQVFLTNHAHSSFFPGTIDEYEAYIKALKEFHKILYEISITIKTEPGDMLVMDNHRLLHGRKGFPSDEERALEGWYIEWDMVLSKLRVAKINQSQATGCY